MSNFRAYGYYTLTNSIGYEIEISECGDAARVFDGETVSDWREIIFQEDEDGKMEPIIDGFEIPLNLVMKINR